MHSSVVGFENQLYSEQELDIFRKLRQACMEKTQALQDEVYRLKVQIQRLDIALAPHNKLPPEVLRRIFELCCEEPAHIPPFRTYTVNRSTGIYTISHVCSLWRQIALSTPEFWANISIQLWPINNDYQLQIAEQWFSRAGNHPTSLILMDIDCETALHLSIPRTQIMPLKELLNGPLPDYLEALDFRWCSQMMLKRKWPNLCKPTTRLTKLIDVRFSKWYRWGHDVQCLMTVIPWNQLQYLDLLFWIPYSHCLDILSECTSLVRCHMHLDDLPADTSISSAWRPVTLPALHVLRLVFKAGNTRNNGSHVEQTIRFLSAPKLSHITLGQLRDGSYPATSHCLQQVRLRAPAICELLERSNGMPDLVSLDLGVRSSKGPPIDVRALLTKAPRLRLLHIRNGIFNEDVRNDIATGTLAPQLHSIMTEVRHEAIDILRMVELRRQNARTTLVDNTRQVTEFSSISFSCHKHVPDSQQHSAFIERLESLKKSSPRLSIKLKFD